MKCDFEHCVYNQDLKCIIDKIQINAFGMCDNCTLIALDENFIRDSKRQQLKDLEG